MGSPDNSSEKEFKYCLFPFFNLAVLHSLPWDAIRMYKSVYLKNPHRGTLFCCDYSLVLGGPKPPIVRGNEGCLHLSEVSNTRVSFHLT